jgi:hypothetical protein
MTTKINLAALTVLAAVLFAAPLTASAYVNHDAAMTSSTLGTASGAHHHHRHHRHHRHPH